MAIPQPKNPSPEDKIRAQVPADVEQAPSNDPPVQPVPVPGLSPKAPLIGDYIDRGITYHVGDTVYPDRVQKLNEKAIADRKAEQEQQEQGE